MYWLRCMEAAVAASVGLCHMETSGLGLVVSYEGNRSGLGCVVWRQAGWVCLRRMEASRLGWVAIGQWRGR